MSMIYGHKWTSSFGVRDDGTWKAGLSDMKPDELKQGIEKCLTSDDEWPPTLNQFRNLCRAINHGLSHSTAAYRPFDKTKALEHKADPEKARSYLDEMKSKLNQGE